MTDMDRRIFLKKIVRLSTAGGLTGLAIFLYGKPNTDINDTEICNQTSSCRKCSRLSGCTQTRALTRLAQQNDVPDSLKANMRTDK